MMRLSVAMSTHTCGRISTRIILHMAMNMSLLKNSALIKATTKVMTANYTCGTYNVTITVADAATTARMYAYGHTRIPLVDTWNIHIVSEDG